MTEHTLLMMAFNEENQPLAAWVERGSMLDIDDKAHRVLMESPEPAIVLGWTIDGKAFIDRNAPPVVDVRLPWVG